MRRTQPVYHVLLMFTTRCSDASFIVAEHDHCGAEANRQRLSTPSHLTRSVKQRGAVRGALLRSGRDRIELHPARCVLCATNWGTAWQYCIEPAEWRSLDYGILQTCGHAAIRFRVCSRAVEGSLTRPPTRALMQMNVLSR